MTDTLSPDLLSRMNAYWRAANYLSVGQVYLLANPLLRHVTVAEGAAQKVGLSKDCQIQVKNLGKQLVVMDLIGKGEIVSTIKKPLPKGEALVTGGNAPNLTAWFVVLKPAE